MTQQPPPGPDKVQREIEELLDRLDTFVPEERLATKIRSRARQHPRGEPGALQRMATRLRRVTYGQMVLGGLGLIVAVFFFRGPLGDIAGPLMIAGLIIAVAGFALSVVNGGAARTLGTSGGRVEKRWRGQVIDYSEPSTIERLRGWLRGRRRR